MNTNRNDPERDVRLSAAYRDLQDARTPAHLDEKVLRSAAREARTRYGLARAWTRPLAWAAVVVLCLTYALELTRVDDVSDATPYLDSPAPAARSPASLKRSQDPGKAEIGAALTPTAAVSEEASFAAEDQGRIATEALPACDESERKSPDDWYACIRRLQDDGQAESAERELEALRQAFPEFTIPATHK